MAKYMSKISLAGQRRDRNGGVTALDPPEVIGIDGEVEMVACIQ